MQNAAQEVWAQCLDFIKERISPQNFQTWFSPVKPLKLENKTLTIQVPSQFFYEWLEEHYVYLLRQAIDEVIGRNGLLQYSVIVDKGNKNNQPLSVNLPTHTSGNEETKEEEKAEYAYAEEKVAEKNKKRNGNGNGNNSRNNGTQGSDYKQGDPDDLFIITESGNFSKDPHLSRHYNFNSYIEGDCNRLARSAGYAVSQNPGMTSFNPLMVYGGVGLGKTHLIQAIGNEIKDLYNDKFVLYVSSEKFTAQFINALMKNKVRQFTNFFLHVDVLIIDDVQFLAGKEKTQEIFFHIFNHLHQSGKQIIMTSDCPPKNLKGLQERLLSRFKWGLTADLQKPDFETRVAIIKHKMKADGIDIPAEVLEYLAYSIDTNIRELEGVLVSLIAQASLNRMDIDLELAKKTLGHIVEYDQTELDIPKIQNAVAEYFKIGIDEMKSKTRKREVVQARQMAMYLSKEYTRNSLKAIGYHFGGRDHTTVIHAVQAVKNGLDVKNSNTPTYLKELENTLRIKKKK